MKRIIGILLVFVLMGVHASSGWKLSLQTSTRGEVTCDGVGVVSILPGLHVAPNWARKDFTLMNFAKKSSDGIHGVTQQMGYHFTCDLFSKQVAPNTYRFSYTLTSVNDAPLNSLHVSLLFPVEMVLSGRYSANGGAERRLPSEFSMKTKGMFNGKVTEFKIVTDKGPLTLRFPKPEWVLFQDNRNWSQDVNMCVRINATNHRQTAITQWAAGQSYTFEFDMVFPGDVTVEKKGLVVIQEGEDWVPVKTLLGIKEGSALDFSNMGFRDAPAGKHGWMKAVGEDFEFEGLKGVKQRFYGVNLVGSAQTVTKEQAVELAERISRLGYNAVRFHHYGNATMKREPKCSTNVDPRKLDLFDFLFAEFKKRGIYATTDVYSSRDVWASEIFEGHEGKLSFQEFRAILPFSDKAFENWKTFARNFFTHRNPYTGLTYLEDPALTTICLVNEGNFHRPLDKLIHQRTVDVWLAKWNEWSRKRYPDWRERNRVWKATYPEVIVQFTSAMSDAERKDFELFKSEVHTDLYKRMERFMREELKCKALLTNMNHGGFSPQEMLERNLFDYVDQHFYIDHPSFYGKRWSLPAFIRNESVIKKGEVGGILHALTRIYGKPFTVTEVNYSYPGQYRGVGGILTGCLGSLQNWAGIYRFAYSHGGRNMFRPSRMAYFDLASDLLNQASERATICLYLRQDLQEAPRRIALSIAPDYVTAVKTDKVVRNIYNVWAMFGFLAKTGLVIGQDNQAVDFDITLGLSPDGPKGRRHIADNFLGTGGIRAIWNIIKEQKWLPAGNKTTVDERIRRLHAVHGQFDIDIMADRMVLNTPRTAGGYAPAGDTIATEMLEAVVRGSAATVWASSLDGKPINGSERILVNHLTDVQNSGVTFADSDQRTLLAWGRMPLLARVGRATVTLKHERPSALKGWMLSTDGERIASLPLTVVEGGVRMELDVRGPQGGQLLYEIAVEK